MRKLILTLTILFFSTTAYASLQDQQQGQLQGQQQGQAQGQYQGNTAGQGNQTDVTTNEDVDVKAPTWAPTPSTEGKEESAVYTLFGGVNQNKLSFDVQTDHYIKTLKLALSENVITQSEYDDRINEIVNEAKRKYQKNKLIGVINFTPFRDACDNAILNLFCW
jgi:hypothetical protein